jgi:hypothetical protein
MGVIIWSSKHLVVIFERLRHLIRRSSLEAGHSLSASWISRNSKILSNNCRLSGPSAKCGRNSYPDTYIIIGWFQRGSLDPREKLPKLRNETDLFKQMRKGIRSVRGWRRVLSLTSLHSFGPCQVSYYK